ncbi:Oidioi.mRNA.OKI2018_I69.chr2.g5147.t1.cds [Oikopleura dioica]|uniref:Carbohydrate sulfotransferase n=1 Tax=Oikopleura dioica TaxID=34765 RepID=A0ABN7T554_OIKDI|nr:Oidioi.mRNA.OKI2018_I69.chr2.g5147.t1.cds [Oikopleura dioica]
MMLREYVAANPGNKAMNHHWTTIFNLCSPCAIKYELITHLENSKEEIPKILELINLSELEIGGQYSLEEGKEGANGAGKDHERRQDELHWSKIPRKTVEELYRHFYLDFVIFGYSTEDVAKYINAADESQSRPSKDAISKSRLILKNMTTNYEKHFTDDIC